MRITVVGKSPSWQDTDGACSGYLVEEGPTAVLLDCGNGVFGKLRRFRDYCAIDAVVISHLHADHFLDLIPYAYALTYAPRQQPVPVDRWPGTDTPARPALHAPAGAREIFRTIVGCWGQPELIENAFDLHEYDPDETVEIGEMRLRFHDVPHYVETHAVEVSSTNGSGRFTFGADSCPTTSSWSSPRAPTSSSSRRPCRGPSARARAGTSRPARPATTPTARARAGWSSPTSPTRWTCSGQRPRPRRPTAARLTWHEKALRTRCEAEAEAEAEIA